MKSFRVPVFALKSPTIACLSFIQSESQFVQWVKISNVAFDLQNDIILGCVYVPPEGSKYSNSESFDEIELLFRPHTFK
jgi:hypothetical protein